MKGGRTYPIKVEELPMEGFESPLGNREFVTADEVLTSKGVNSYNFSLMSQQQSFN